MKYLKKDSSHISTAYHQETSKYRQCSYTSHTVVSELGLVHFGFRASPSSLARAAVGSSAARAASCLALRSEAVFVIFTNCFFVQQTTWRNFTALGTDSLPPQYHLDPCVLCPTACGEVLGPHASVRTRAIHVILILLKRSNFYSRLCLITNTTIC